MQTQPIPFERLVLICLNQRPEGEPSCGGRDSAPLAEAIKEAVNKAGLKGRVRVSKTHCLGQCQHGPNVMVYPEGTWFSHVRPEDVPAIVEAVTKPEAK